MEPSDIPPVIRNQGKGEEQSTQHEQDGPHIPPPPYGARIGRWVLLRHLATPSGDGRLALFPTASNGFFKNSKILHPGRPRQLPG